MNNVWWHFVCVTVDSSATETEDETKHNGVLQQKKVKKKKKKSRKENKDGVPGMGGNRTQWGGNRKHSPPSAHHPPMKFGRKVQPQHNGVVGGGIQNKPKKVGPGTFVSELCSSLTGSDILS